MANELYKQYGGNDSKVNNLPDDGGFADFIQQFQQFKLQFRGNPQEQIQRMLQSGQISQEQLNKAQQLAQQFIRFWPDNVDVNGLMPLT